jgi:hypothetical protein
MKRVYFRISSFALGSLTGGCWENDQLVSAATPEEAFAEALKEVDARVSLSKHRSPCVTRMGRI